MKGLLFVITACDFNFEYVHHHWSMLNAYNTMVCFMYAICIYKLYLAKGPASVDDGCECYQ